MATTSGTDFPRRTGDTAVGPRRPTVRALGPATLALALVLIAGCTAAGSGGGSPAGPELRLPPRPSSGPTGTGGPEESALTARDLPGHTVTEVPVPAGTGKTDRKECEPLARLLTATAVGKSESTGIRRSSSRGVTTTVTLAGYGQDGATAALEAVSTAADLCADGFAFTSGGQRRAVTGVVRELAPQGADQAMALALTTGEGGTEHRVKAVVLRLGDRAAHFITPVPAASPDGFAVPREVVEAQLRKLLA
jgi:hypothetical protein